jgi:hypothetical protein
MTRAGLYKALSKDGNPSFDTIVKAKSFVLALIAGLLLLSVASAKASADAPAGSSVDLTGNWVLCQDEDHGPKDAMKFFPEGYGFELRSNRPKVPFLYEVSGGEILLALNVSGKMLTLYLTVNSEHTKLTLTDQRTGHLAFYVRSGQEKKFNCTAK